MKIIGLIGGLTWVSTVEYYNIINSEVNKRAGGHNAAHIILHSVNFGEYKKLADADKWDVIGKKLNDTALKIQSAGAEMLIICSNTPHKVASEILKGISIPFIHIADVTAQAIADKKLGKVALLGTKFTMTSGFYKSKIAERGIETIVPGEGEREYIHNSIFDELGKNIFKPETKSAYIEIINRLVNNGAEGIILGCTEIPLLIKQQDCPVPVFDTTLIHAQAAVDFILK